MRLTRKQLEQLAYDTMDEYNRKLGTTFSANTVELAFFTPKNGVAVYEEICTRYFKRHLSEKYKSPDFFENFAAMAMIGDIKDGILVREDMDIPEYEWHHIFLHELSHILACREEIGGELFYDRFCMDYAESPEEDGYINAGYAIWREFSAELFAMDLDDDCTPFSINEVKNYIINLCKEITLDNPNAKEAMYRLLIYLFKSDDYYLSKDADEFLERIKKCGVSVVLDFEPVIRLIFAHLAGESAWKIDVDFITELGFLYSLSITDKRLNVLVNS